MTRIRTKKSLGQHFLKDEILAEKIVSEIMGFDLKNILEIGPGRGVLTKYLNNIDDFETSLIEIDTSLVEYLRKKFGSDGLRIIEADFLKFEIGQHFSEKIGIIGNFPYNISSQVLFRVLENKEIVSVVVGMFQKEVAERIVTGAGSKKYGILSVLIQAYYNAEYLYTVDEQTFEPPPKVKSAVIRLVRNNVNKLDCNEVLFKRIVKTCFNQRRKIIRNSIKSIISEFPGNPEILSKRPEQLNTHDFVTLTKLVENNL